MAGGCLLCVCADNLILLNLNMKCFLEVLICFSLPFVFICSFCVTTRTSPQIFNFTFRNSFGKSSYSLCFWEWDAQMDFSLVSVCSDQSGDRFSPSTRQDGRKMLTKTLLWAIFCEQKWRRRIWSSRCLMKVDSLVCMFSVYYNHTLVSYNLQHSRSINSSHVGTPVDLSAAIDRWSITTALKLHVKWRTEIETSVWLISGLIRAVTVTGVCIQSICLFQILIFSPFFPVRSLCCHQFRRPPLMWAVNSSRVEWNLLSELVLIIRFLTGIISSELNRH